MNQIKVLIVVAAVCVAAWAQSAPPLPPLPSAPPTVPAVPADPSADAPADSAADAPADSAADAPADAAPAASSDGAGTCYTCGLETPSCTYDSFTVPDGDDAAYQKGASDPTRPCTFCIVQKSEDPEQNIVGLYRGCNDYDPTNGGTSPSYTYDQDGVTYTVTTKACNTPNCNKD